jgi:tryptophanyl-tRNA synthetase
VFQLYRAFASAQETAAMREAFAQGIGWGDAKTQLFERIDREVAPMRERYQALMARPADIEGVLREGASRLRGRYATPLLGRLREAVGLRNLATAGDATQAVREKAALPVFKQYREGSQFFFKLVDGERVLLQSLGHDSGRTAGQLVARLKQEGGAALRAAEGGAVHLGGELLGHLHDAAELADVVEALARLVESE